MLLGGLEAFQMPVADGIETIVAVPALTLTVVGDAVPKA